MPSERKATAIYSVVYNRLMDLRVSLKMSPPKSADDLDTRLARAMDQAEADAVTAYRDNLGRKRGK